jgi:hypothetical protein
MEEYVMGWSRLPICPSVCLLVSTQELLDGKNKIWYGYYARGDYLQVILLDVLRLVVTKWWIRKFVRWDPQLGALW